MTPKMLPQPDVVIPAADLGLLRAAAHVVATADMLASPGTPTYRRHPKFAANLSMLAKRLSKQINDILDLAQWPDAANRPGR